MKDFLRRIMFTALFVSIIMLLTITIDFLITNANATSVLKIQCQFKRGDVSLEAPEGQTFHTHEKADGMYVTIHIENTSKLSEVNDYIEFTKDGKNVLYSLKCKVLSKK
jgi:hypothetical protein